MILSEFIKEIREKKGLKQFELAELLDLHKSTICYYESNSRSPSRNTLKKMSLKLGVNFDYLLSLKAMEGLNAK